MSSLGECDACLGTGVEGTNVQGEPIKCAVCEGMGETTWTSTPYQR